MSWQQEAKIREDIFKMRKLKLFLTLLVILFCGGCRIIGVLGIPTRHEQRIPAEYDLSRAKDKKVLVLVEQPTWLGAEVNLRYQITNAVIANLMSDIRFRQEQFVSYDELLNYRQRKANFSLLSPVEIGEALNADIVLHVMLGRYEVTKLADSKYYNGLLDLRAVLYDVASAKKLWPSEDKSKVVKVGLDAESRGSEVVNGRLVKASSHCIVRYLYNCPKDRFKIAGDRSEVDWEKW